MSVLIKGVRLPSNCLHCPMQFGGFCYVKPDLVEGGRVASTVDEAYKQGRPSWCPLEEVPSAELATNLQPTCNIASNCISRQAAIDACIRVREYRAYDEIEEIKALPSAHPESAERNEESKQNVPNDDLISRKMAIEKFWHSEVEYRLTQIDDVMSILKGIPSAQPEPQMWIPCSERLPDEPFGCLVTVWDTNPVTMDEFENILPYFVGWDGEQWNDADGEQCPFEVIAWMPLPEEYKGEE